MIFDILMPFAEAITTRKVVGIAEVERGDQCNCRCLSCKTPVTARKGEVNQWHFSHRTDKTITEKDCQYSPITAIALILRQQLSLLPSLQIGGHQYDNLRWSIEAQAYGQSIDLLAVQPAGGVSIAIEVPFASDTGFCTEKMQEVDIILSIDTKAIASALFSTQGNTHSYLPEDICESLLTNWSRWVKELKPSFEDLQQEPPVTVEPKSQATEESNPIVIHDGPLCRCCGSRPGTTGKGLLCGRCVFLNVGVKFANLTDMIRYYKR
ncbi:hypothetical protein [Vibrio furnissii]|uniref:competence protein CoiA family protein n=1 Tax=Vibrio furnissii TaxID=29494 RepID=UPI003AA8665A